MQAVKKGHKGIVREEMRVGNLYLDENGEIKEWELKDYLAIPHPEGGHVYERYEPILIDYSVAKALDFKFRHANILNVGYKSAKGKTGFLHAKAGQEYLWRSGYTLRLKVSSMMMADSDFAKEVLNTLKDDGFIEYLKDFNEIKKELTAGQVSNNMNIITEIDAIHELQNHWFYLTGLELDLSNFKQSYI